jgi:hypothetical protein
METLPSDEFLSKNCCGRLRVFLVSIFFMMLLLSAGGCKDPVRLEA